MRKNTETLGTIGELTNYVHELIRKIAAGFKDKVLSLFNRQKKKLKHTKNKKKKKKEIKDGIIKDKIIRNIRVPF